MPDFHTSIISDEEEEDDDDAGAEIELGDEDRLVSNEYIV
jgi:hypothetical protein